MWRRSLPKDAELRSGHKPIPRKAEWVTNKKKRFIFLSSLLILQLFHCFTRAFQKCPRAVEILQPLLRKPWENYSDICFHLLLFAFSPLVFLFLWPRTNFSMLTILTIPKKFHLSVGTSPRRGMQWSQLNSSLLPAVSRAALQRFCVKWCLGEGHFPGLARKTRTRCCEIVALARGRGSSTSAKHRELQKHPRALYFFLDKQFYFR